MVREEVQKDVERIVDTDFRLQKLYMTSKPKRLEVIAYAVFVYIQYFQLLVYLNSDRYLFTILQVFDDDFLKELNTFQLQETSAREGGIGTTTIGATRFVYIESAICLQIKYQLKN